MAIDAQLLKQWIGRQEKLIGTMTPTQLNALSATLDRNESEYAFGTVVPHLWHWLYFIPLAQQSEVGADGHPKRGGFLPPVTLPRRMWAGGQLTFHAQIPVGSEVERISTIIDVTHKSGRSGDLVFVKLSHELFVSGHMLVAEVQDIVYRDHPKPEDAPVTGLQSPSDYTWSKEIVPDPVLLFRYSALTFNGHRIHYDRPYAIEEEGYKGLVVHGPLIATLLMNLLRENLPDSKVLTFSFRAMRPLFDMTPFKVCAKLSEDQRSVHLWAQDADGYLCMDAMVTLK